MNSILVEDNLRFTREDEVLYVIALEWPGAGKSLDISSLGGNQGIGKISEVTMLGQNENLAWEQNSEGLRIVLPVSPPCEYAQSFRVVFSKGIEK